ncbi:MAG: ABC transporter ATP-binding protein [Trueperaceae bacterium]|nr:ABC transporter ATP-binding protein [Trueperaceae bacterium]
MSQPYFKCSDMHAYYGESYILRGVGFKLEQNELLALLGRNGAGKTTTLRSIARAQHPNLRQGEVWLNGEAIHKLPAHKAAQRGISLVPEERKIIPGLTVEENLILAQIAPPRGWPIDRIYELFPRLQERKHQIGTTLSGGEQQMLAVARALARDVALLLLDEPYEGLAPLIVKDIERVLITLKEEGMTIVLVEQNAIGALKIADRCVILEMGEVVFDGDPKDVLDSEELRREYLAL